MGAERRILDNAHKLSVLWGLVVAARVSLVESCDALFLVGAESTTATLVVEIPRVEDGLPAAVDADGLG